MLILARRHGERIFITSEDSPDIKICITVRGMKGGQVSLGIDADSSYTILREEVFVRNAQGMRGIEYPGEDFQD